MYLNMDFRGQPGGGRVWLKILPNEEIQVSNGVP